MESLKGFSSEYQFTQFEEDYLTRTYGKITNRPDLALTELVANAWDGGAESVSINISPISTVEQMTISIHDDGVGMTEQEFYNRWMTLAYNRLRHQGEYAEMPPERIDQKRRAYGRNGIGRHSMLCFGNTYTVETLKNGLCNVFTLEQSGGKTALKITSHNSYSKDGHGTIISATINKNYPNVYELKTVLSARFIFDPQFKISINGTLIGIDQFDGFLKREEATILDDINITMTALSSNKTAKDSQQHGVAFWVNKRLVGEPSWHLNKKYLADGRTTTAKQYTIIVQTNDLLSDINPDWTAFKENDRMDAVYKVVESFTNDVLKGANAMKNEDFKHNIIRKYAKEIQNLEYTSRRNILQLVDKVVDEIPELSKSFLDVTISKLLDINKSMNKRALLEKIFILNEKDAEALNKVLDDWDVSDLEYVLDEVDRRITAIEAIRRFSTMEGADELHVLHPLVLEAKWLFGAEFDSSFYVSNKRLSTILKKHLKKPENVKSLVVPMKRPDIIVFDDGSLMGYATEDHNPDTGLVEYKRLLLIELKCGGKEITTKEMNQTEEYINELFFSNAFNSYVEINAFTVGTSVSARMSRGKELKDSGNITFGKITAASYEQLVATAERRLFGLKEQLSQRYESLDEDNLLKKALSPETAQAAMAYILEKDK